tara:strand:- start:870 stop:1613 length:744 start_codon:yes stop_codon:yes gene_type:complete
LNIKYHIKIEYDGTNFAGWQYQKNALSIQEILQKAISKYLRHKTAVIGSGRTDTGVHAIEQAAHFETKLKIVDFDKFIFAINFHLKKYPIVLTKVEKKNYLFHARYSAKKRTYKYLIFNRKSSSPLNQNRVWFIRKKLNLAIMIKCLKYLKGKHDFSTFRASSCQAKTPVRTISSVSLKKSKDIIEIKFTSRSFLQNQVRSMVGAIKYVGEKKWTLNKFIKNFNSRKRSNCAPPAPACGLYLEKIQY